MKQQFNYRIAHLLAGAIYPKIVALLSLLLIFCNPGLHAADLSTEEGLPIVQQLTKLKGKVTDALTNEGIPGANVLVQGTTTGVITDIDGNYSLEVEPGSTLVFSFIGYESKTVSVLSGQTVLNISLEVSVSELDEVVVIGYGAVKKRDLTGAVASVKSEDITRIPTHNAVEAIQGRVAGVDITRSSGQAGAGVEVRIRGNRSITAKNDPLYIIDGFMGGSISDLNPSDIASVEVLKDASSTAIYGYQGANGVIIITTKRGSNKGSKVSYSGYQGINGFTEYPETRRGQDYINMRREARINGISDLLTKSTWRAKPDEDFFSPAEWEAISQDKWVDWVDLVMQNGRQMSHTVSVTGGSDKTQAYASLGWFGEESMYRGNTYDRYTLRLNLDHQVYKWLKAGVLSQFTFSETDGRNDPLRGAISSKPFGDVYDENGDIIINPVIGEPNTISPLADEIPGFVDMNDRDQNSNLNAYLEITPVKGLKLRTNLGTKVSASRDGEFLYKDSYSRRTERTTYTGIVNTNAIYYHWDNILSYTKEIDKHAITLTGVTNYVENKSEFSSASGLGQQLTSQSFHKLSATTTQQSINSGFTKSNTMSYAARINYSFAGKYLLTASNRYDQASMLTAERRGDWFPSAALAWRVSDEAFMDEVTFIDEFKIRASYGKVGNSNIGAYATQSSVIPSSRMGFGDVSAPMYQFSGVVGNTSIGWEKTTSVNLGVDIGFIKGRINLAVDAYKSETADILLNRKLPWSTGGRDMVVAQNIGSTESKGIEVLLNSVNVENRNFKWTTSLTMTSAQEFITGLVDSTDIIVNETDSWLIGRPINSFYTYKKLGIWQLDEAEEAALLTFGGSPFEPGDIKLLDVDGDSAITAADRTYLGSRQPKFFLGIQNNFNYKGIELNVFFVGRFGQMISADHLARYDPAGKAGTLAIYDYWTEDNPTNDYPKPENKVLFSIPGYQTLPIIDASYVKLKTLSLSYTLPKKWLSNIAVSNFKIYATASNWWIKSRHHLLENYDPEGGGDISYPLNKQLVFGVNLDF